MSLSPTANRVSGDEEYRKLNRVKAAASGNLRLFGTFRLALLGLLAG